MDGMDQIDEELLEGDLVEVEDNDHRVEEDTDDVDDTEEIEEIENEEKQEMIVEEIPDNAIFTFTEHTDAVCCVAVHPFDQCIVATGGCDDRAFLWRFSNSEKEQWCYPLVGHTDTVTSIGFNFNGKLLLTGSYDGTVRIWDVSTREQIQLLEGPDDIEWAAWHTKGNAVVAGSKDGTVWLWLTHNGQCIQVFSGHDGLVTNGCFVSDGKFICTGGEDGSVRFWNPKTGICKSMFEKNPEEEELVSCIHSQGDYAAAGKRFVMLC
jgi:WD40 repeat protein